MAQNLTDQVREIASVTTAVAHGDLTKKIERPAKGEILQLQQTINTMVDQLRTFASEVTRVARDVGTEGILGGQADVEGVQGMWNELTVNVNAMANNLTTQVRDIIKVTTAVAKGDLTQKVQAECRGEIFELKKTINSMVDQLQQFAREVTKIAREVGTEGRLGGQATVHDVQGTWRDLTENVNGMAMNLTTQVREIAKVTTAVAKGDLTKKIGVEVQGEILDLKNTINTMVDRLGTFAFEVSKVAREVGTDGTLGGQAQVDNVEGKWKDLTENVNTMASNLTSQVRYPNVLCGMHCFTNFRRSVGSLPSHKPLPTVIWAARSRLKPRERYSYSRRLSTTWLTDFPFSATRCRESQRMSVSTVSWVDKPMLLAWRAGGRRSPPTSTQWPTTW